MLARFITPDTIYDVGPQGLNRYSYALNNPIVFNDPTGHYVDPGQDDGASNWERPPGVEDWDYHSDWQGTKDTHSPGFRWHEKDASVVELKMTPGTCRTAAGLHGVKIHTGYGHVEEWTVAEDGCPVCYYRPAEWWEPGFVYMGEEGIPGFAFGMTGYVSAISSSTPSSPPKTKPKSKSTLRTSEGKADSFQYEKLKAQLAQEELLGAEPTGSALKGSGPFLPRTFGRGFDVNHAAPTFVKDTVASGRHFTIRGYDGVYRNLTQVKGVVNGESGIFEYIVGPEGLTHQRFIVGGQITGSPNQ